MSPTLPVPALTEPRPPRELTVAERTTGSGLRVAVVRKPGIPLAEIRLRVPMLAADPSHPAHAELHADTLLTGAGSLDRAELAAAVQALGADLSVNVDADRLLISGNALATGLPGLLELLAVVLTTASFPEDEVAGERDRLVERLTIARSRPGVVAGEALALRMWGRHPYALELPQTDAVAATTRTDVAELHRQRVRPDGAVLVIVGDVDPDAVHAQVETALAEWTGTGPAPEAGELPTPPGGPLKIIDRPNSVQSTLRLGRSALTRTDPAYPALQLANLIFGGYFSSRWTENVREDKGYTYGPHSRIDHHVLGSALMLDVEMAKEVTGPTWHETRYELDRIADSGVTAEEVAAVRQYAIGTLALSTATQAGLASNLSALSAFGLGLDWIVEHPARLEAVTVEQVSTAAAEFFPPAGFTGVVVGDAASITEPLAELGPVE